MTNHPNRSRAPNGYHTSGWSDCSYRGPCITLDGHRAVVTNHADRMDGSGAHAFWVERGTDLFTQSKIFVPN